MLGMTPVRRHLPTTRCWILSGSHSLKQHLGWCHPKAEAQCSVTVIREEPVMTWLENLSCRGLSSLVACTGDLKEDSVEALELNLRIVQCSTGQHRSIEVQTLFSS